MKLHGNSKFKIEYCETLKIGARRNDTIERFCADNGISVDTYYKWVKRHEEFAEAHKEALTIRKANFLGKAYDCAFKPDKNPCNNGMAYLFAYNIGLKVKPEKEDESSESEVADAIREIASKLPR